MNDFFERATVLRDTIASGDTSSKDVQLDILSQLVAQVFRYEKIPYNFTVQSSNVNVRRIAIEILQELEIEVQTSLSKTSIPSYQITTAHLHVNSKS